MSDEPSYITFSERVTPTFTTTTHLRDILYKEKSKYQDVGVIETTDFGKTLTIDKRTQSSQLDEFVYHESLVHPAMIAHECPKSVYIGGGGEGATAREVLRHKTVERLVMVDIDDFVVQVCKKHLPEWSAGCYDDPRLELVIGDAKAWLMKTDEKFDVIILDISDPTEGGPGITLYYQSFYKTVYDKLNQGGIFVTQSGGAGLLTFMECFTVIHNTMKGSFDKVYGYSAEVPSFGSPWGFNVGFKSTDAIAKYEDIDERICKRLKNPGALKFYDSVAHQGMFGLPKYIRKALDDETRVLTENQEYYIF